MIDYSLLKFLHILGACLFLGNNLVTPFWRMLAERTGNAATIAYSQRLITLTDYVFNGVGIVLLLGAGHLMAAGRPELWQQIWFWEAYACFSLSGALWLTVLVPVQIRQSRLAREFAQGGEIPAAYWRLATIWKWAGSVASVLPLASLYLMVAKPV